MILKFSITDTQQAFYTALSKKDADFILKHSPYQHNNQVVVVEAMTDRSQLCNVILKTEHNAVVGEILKTLQKRK
jgi:hypothetical protein